MLSFHLLIKQKTAVFLLLSLLFSCCLFNSLHAQDDGIFKPDSVKRRMHATEISSLLKIDGQLNEPEWNSVDAISQFIQVEPYQGASANFETRVKTVYNRHFLYFGIFASDTAGMKALRATNFKRDFDDRQHDLVSISFDGFNDQRNAMCFAVNPWGVQKDFLSFDDLYFDENWDGLWKVRTTRTDSGWYAEISIPWQTLRYPKTTDALQSWGINIYRNRRLSNEITAFSPYPRVFTASRMNYAGVIDSLRPPPPKPNIRIQPYLLGAFDRYKNFDPSVDPKQSSVKIGGDLKWAINTNSVLDITANTDFAQADVDLQVNNVTRFSVFFPEKRQFFLENASLFSPVVKQATDGSGGMMQLQPFFSRTIGLDNFGNPIPILAGGRFVHRSSSSNYGAIVMRQDASDNSEATNFFVGRYSQNFGGQNRIGGLVTVKNSPGASNVESTVDAFIRLGESQSLNTIISHSVTTNTNKQGIAGVAQYYLSTNNYKIWLTQSVVTKDYDPQMGFVSRNDVIGTTPGMNWYYRGKALPFKKLIRAFEPGVLPEFYWQASTGRSIERSFSMWPIWINFQSGAYFGFAITPVFQSLTTSFEPLGVVIAPGNYNYTQEAMMLSTDPSKAISFATDLKFGEYFNGRLTSADFKLQIAPVPHVSILAQFNRNKFTDVGIQKGKSVVDLYIVQGRFAINPRIQLIGFYQKNSLDKSQNYNIRFSWEYKPLSQLYLIFNHSEFYNLQMIRQTEDHSIVKLSWLKQF